MMKITTDQLRAAYDALGLDGEKWEHTSEITMLPDAVVVRVMESPLKVTGINTIEASTLVYPVTKPDQANQ